MKASITAIGETIEADKTEGQIPNQWALINRALVGYKWVSILLALLCVALTGLSTYQAARGPVVVMERLGQKEFFAGRHGAVQITDDDVKSAIEHWIRLRYEWRELDPESIARNIAPLSTDGLQAKVREMLLKQKSHSPPEQKLAEAVSGIQVTLGEHDAEGTFDLILRVNGIPLVIPTVASFQVIKGASTRWNPAGLYINGVVEREEK